MNDRRDATIDTLRAVAITGVIITHVLARNLGPSAVNTAWNYLHLMVPLLIFCSGYVTFLKYHDTEWDMNSTIRWFRKRAARLILPYYAFFIFQSAAKMVFPAMMTASGISFTPGFFLKSLFLIGIDYGWLPLLFLQMMLITPFILGVFRSRAARTAMFIVTAATATLLAFIRVPYVDYRIYMWVPWSSVLILSFLAAERDRREEIPAWVFSAYSAAAFIIYLCLGRYYDVMGIPRTLTLHKYPPDLFYLSYGIGVGSLLLSMMKTGIFSQNAIRVQTAWLSTRSYSLFFIHYIVIDVLMTYLSHSPAVWLPLQIVIVISGTIVAQHLYDTSIRRISRIYSGK